MVCVTGENFLINFCLTRAAHLCTVSRARLCVLSLVILALLVYDFALWTTSIVPIGDSSYCLTSNSYHEILLVMTCVDTILTLVIPTLLMITLLLPSCVKNIVMTRKGDGRNIRPLLSRRHRHLLRVSRLLCVITASAVVLTTPEHIIKLRQEWTIVFTGAQPSHIDMTVQYAFMILASVSQSCNVVYFLIWGKNFRKVIRACGKRIVSTCCSQNTDGCLSKSER